jgi:hypothetical protein
LWWQVDYLGGYAWVSSQFVRADADIYLFPTVQAPPLVNRDPFITSLDPMTVTIEPGNAVTFTCQASDLDGNALSYTWSASDGSVSGEGETVVYNAPETIGKQTITVRVEDGHGSYDESVAYVEIVLPEPPPGRFIPSSPFRAIWQAQPAVRLKLGWAKRDVVVNTTSAQQFFDRGIILWHQGQRRVFVLAQDSTYQDYASTWEENMGDYACLEPDKHQTPQMPRQRIGKVWCEELGGEEAAIGWATADQIVYDADWQDFDGGLMWQGADGRTYILYQDGTWDSYANPQG